MSPENELRGELVDVFQKYDLDLILLHQADPLFRYEIMSRGRLLHGRADDFLEYKAWAYRGYVESYDLRQLEEILFQKKFDWIKSQLHGSA